MRFSCPSCAKELAISDEKLPPVDRFIVNCPDCQEKLVIDKARVANPVRLMAESPPEPPPMRSVLEDSLARAARAGRGVRVFWDGGDGRIRGVRRYPMFRQRVFPLCGTLLRRPGTRWRLEWPMILPLRWPRLRLLFRARLGFLPLWRAVESRRYFLPAPRWFSCIWPTRAGRKGLGNFFGTKVIIPALQRIPGKQQPSCGSTPTTCCWLRITRKAVCC